MRLCPSIGQSVGPSHLSLNREKRTLIFDAAIVLCVWEGGRVGVRLEVGWPCPPNCNDLVTPRHLFNYYTCRPARGFG